MVGNIHCVVGREMSSPLGTTTCFNYRLLDTGMSAAFLNLYYTSYDIVYVTVMVIGNFQNVINNLLVSNCIQANTTHYVITVYTYVQLVVQDSHLS